MRFIRDPPRESVRPDSEEAENGKGKKIMIHHQLPSNIMYGNHKCVILFM